MTDREPDWARETPSDDQLSAEAREQIAQALRELLDEPDPEAAGEQLVDEP